MAGHEHDWIVIVPDPYDRPTRGVQQCMHCPAEVDRIHPTPADGVEPLASWERELLEQQLTDPATERSPFGPIASGVVRRQHPAGHARLTPDLPGAVVNVTEAVTFLKAELVGHREKDKLVELAKDTVKAHMRKKDVTEFRGISLRDVPFSQWDSDKLREDLGEKAETYRVKKTRSYINVITRKTSR